MYVSRIELFGFKSFMERTILPLGRGVTGVVGPNGCGKSNVVDAIRWVLGETKARSLRGTLLEDVIFNGTDKLRPLGLAEVSLTLKADENFFSELLSPALEADLIASGAEPEVENQTEDAETENEADAAPELAQNKTKFVIVENHKEEDLGTQDLDSDQAEQSDNDNAATATKELAQDKQAANSNNTAASFENKFTWLKSASEVEITRRLYRSGESEFFINRVPCRLRDIKDICRAVGLTASGYTVVAQGEISRLITSKPEQRRSMLEEAAGVQGFRDKIAAANRRLEETSINLTRLVDIINEISRQVQSLKRQATRAQNRQEIKAEITQLDEVVFKHRQVSFKTRLESIEQETEELQAEEQKFVEQLAHKKADEDQIRAELMQVDLQGDELRQGIDECRQKISQRRQESLKREAEINQLKGQIDYRRSELNRIQDQIKTLVQRQDGVDGRLKELTQEELDYTNKIAAFDADSGAEQLTQMAKDISTLRDNLRQEERDWRELRDKVVSTKSRVDALEQQLVSASPAGQIKQTLQNSGVADHFSKLSIFAKGLVVPQNYSKAVQALLDNRAAYLVAENPYELGQIFVKNRGNKKTGIGIFKLGAAEEVPSAETVSEEQQALLAEIQAKKVLSTIEVEPSYKQVATSLFAGTYFVNDVDSAVKYFAKFSNDYQTTLVTSEGELVTALSFTFFNQDGGLIEIQAKLRSFVEDQEQLNQVYEEKTKTRDALIEEIKNKETIYAQRLAESQNKQRELRQLGGVLGNIKGKLEAERRQLKQCQDDIVRQGNLTVQAEQFVTEKTQALSVLELALKEFHSSNDDSVDQQLKELEQQYSQLEGGRRQRRTQLQYITSAVESCRSELDSARQLQSDLQLREQRLEIEKQDLWEKLVLAYGEEFVQVWAEQTTNESILADENYREQQDQLSKLKARIVREGDVDPESIVRYEEEQARLDELQKQREDLEQATVTLKDSLQRLVKTSEERFLETFELVKNNFAQLIPQLFGGGKGVLELSNTDKPLDGALDIFVCPPGKKPKSLELLSGGEKALCATALIMGMFMVRPSPLCILDEVDAPLDESNLLRFLDVVKSMSNNTQFMLITHNKQSMAVADHLWGVTQEQPGATRILSVSLQEAYKQVA